MTQKLKATFCQFTVEAGRVINRAYLLGQDVRVIVDTVKGDVVVTLYSFDGEKAQTIRLTDYQCLDRLIAMKKSLRYDTGTAYIDKNDDEYIDELLDAKKEAK